MAHAIVRNVGSTTTTMYSKCGDTLQLNAGFHGKIEDRFLHDYNGADVVVVSRPAAVEPAAARSPAPVKRPDPVYPIDASASKELVKTDTSVPDKK